MSDDLLAKWMDDRAGLSEDEALELVRLLERDPNLAARAKEQLLLDEALSRRLAPDRADFPRQVLQRRESAGDGDRFLESTLESVRRARRWRPGFAEAAAALVLVGVLAFLLLRRPEPVSPIASPDARGLHGDYFQGREPRGAATARLDPVLDFEWAPRSGPFPGWRDIYAARWTGTIRAPQSGLYTFRTQNDDGVRVRIDGQWVIDDWKARLVVAENRGTIRLEAGRSYDFLAEYYNSGDRGVLKLYWSAPGLPEEIVPASAFSPSR